MRSNEELARRKELTFAEAEGAAPLPSQLKPKELTRELRAHLWGAVHDSIQWHSVVPWREILRRIHVHRNHAPADESVEAFTVEDLKQIILTQDYVSVFDLIQWILRLDICPPDLTKGIQGALQQCRAAYRLEDGDTFMPLGSEAEGKAIQRAFAELENSEFRGARAHLRKAGEALTAGRAPDSIRQSIHAVESVVRVLEPGGDFGKALAKLEGKISIHGGLKQGFKSVYGFTSDEKGIRHPLLDEPAANVDETDALFMLGACAAFVSYLLNKARGAGLLK